MLTAFIITLLQIAPAYILAITLEQYKTVVTPCCINDQK